MIPVRDYDPTSAPAYDLADTNSDVAYTDDEDSVTGTVTGTVTSTVTSTVTDTGVDAGVADPDGEW